MAIQMDKARRFHGFTTETLGFLRDVAKNNNKEWFKEHKEDYNSFMLKPINDLAYDLTSVISSIDPLLVTGEKSVSRIYRDIRFSKDKHPYKESMWLTFKRPVKDWTDWPAFFFEISATSYRYGMGFYAASAKTMQRLRKHLLKNPERFKNAIDSIDSGFILEGEKYRRPNSVVCEDYLNDWLQRKNIYLATGNPPDSSLFSAGFSGLLSQRFLSLASVYSFFLEAIEI